jgi:hypothetical protein
MPKLVFTQEEIDGYLKERFKHHFYDETVKIAKSMSVHANGEFPEELINERRPNEPQEVIDYRKKIFTAKTKPTFTKIFSSLQKIRRSSDWSIRFDGEFPLIREDETLEWYTAYNYPYFTSLTNWVFSLLLRKYLIDPNAVVFVYPIEVDIPENEILKPIATIFDSEHVIDYVEDDYCVLFNPVGSTFLVRGKEVEGKSYYVITTQQILRYDQVDNKGNFTLASQYDHGMGILPAFKLKGILIDQAENMYLYESRISGVIPELDEAIREYSDLQAAKVLHIYPERWEYTQTECVSCKGTGHRINPAWHEGCDNSIPRQVPCNNDCRNGYVVAGPYSKIMVRPLTSMESAGSATIPTPPAGYVEKDVEIVKIMEESIQGHIYSALSAINFEFLAKTPLSESGIAKEVDKDELNNTVHSIAEDIVSAMDNIYRLIAYYRYRNLYSFSDIEDMLPTVAVPEKFDMLSSVHTQEVLEKAKTGKFNPLIISELERSFTSSWFNTEPEIRDRLSLLLTLDPLPNITEDDKMSRLSNKGITLESYVISSNIQSFIQRAIEENEGFVDMELEKQQEVLRVYAQEVITSNEPEIIEMPDTGLDETGQPKKDDSEITGKIPLAVQQLSLAATRAADSGDVELAASIKAKINQLLGKLVDAQEITE